MKPNKQATHSRRVAHEYMRSIHPEVDWSMYCVHHKDHNPLNNNIDNLAIIPRKKHAEYHNTKLRFIVIDGNISTDVLKNKEVQR